VKVRLVVLAATAVVLVFQLSRQSGRALSPAIARPAAESGAGVGPEAPPATEPALPTIGRDPFRYHAPVEPVASRSQPLVARDTPAPPPSPASPPLRLVGLLRQGSVVRAALSLGGEVSLVAVGDSAFGFTVRAIDEETGVRLAGADGTERLLGPDAFP
jgi:hypothetical protein